MGGREPVGKLPLRDDAFVGGDRGFEGAGESDFLRLTRSYRLRAFPYSSLSSTEELVKSYVD